MQDGNAKQLVTDKVKNSTNILVTVSTDPSVDELSAALGLTLLLNKMDKHATAVFSGQVPPAITFLEPDKTFEDTTDSLRDFIIALDKEKADRLRYKVEDDVVRIFITPYKTTITDKDLQFSQGDFNVELIIALGVEKQEDLDKAIVSHGKILHDATVITINAGDQKSNLGSIDWQDANASSLSEMLVSISESFGSGLLDQQIANALLTGIVAATERFRNNKTSPKVMTMAAQLMAAGANQQLIATKLEEAHVFSPENSEPKDGSTTLSEGESSKLKEEPKKANDGSLSISHDLAAEKTEAATDEANDLAEKAEEERLSKALETTVPAAAAGTDVTAELSETAKEPSWKKRELQAPTMGSALSATSEEALQEKLEAEEMDKNHTILSHDSPMSAPTYNQGVNGGSQEDVAVADKDDSFLVGTPTVKTIAPLPEAPEEPEEEPVPAAPAQELPSPAPETATPPTFTPAEPIETAGKTLAELEEEAHAHAAEAASQAAPALDVQQNLGQAQTAAGDALAHPDPDHPSNIQGLSIAAAPPSLPPLPDMSTLPPLPPGVDPSIVPPLPQAGGLDQATQEPEQPLNQNDPGQFKIPGQS